MRDAVTDTRVTNEWGLHAKGEVPGRVASAVATGSRGSPFRYMRGRHSHTVSMAYRALETVSR